VDRKTQNFSMPFFFSSFFLSSKRFVVFPFREFCCLDESVGLVRPNWLQTDNATFVGTQIVNNRECDVWLAMGNSINYYLNDPSDNFLCLLDDGGWKCGCLICSVF
jgi:hypothetical protein